MIDGLGSELLTGVIGVGGATVGASVSYLLGGRAQRAATRRDVFDRALVAVAQLRVARESPAEATNSILGAEELERLTRNLLVMGVERYGHAQLGAQDALAALVPYWSDADRYRRPWELDDDEVTALIADIRDVRDRRWLSLKSRRRGDVERSVPRSEQTDLG